MKKIWTWDKKLKRYRDAYGRFLSSSALVQLRDLYLDTAKSRATQAVDDYAGGGSLSNFRNQMRFLIRATHVDMFAAGRGGWAQMSPSDWGRAGASIKEQYTYLDRFVSLIADGKVSFAQMLFRAKMYIDSATASFERGQSRAFGLVLPEYPADGNQVCLTKCRCHWDIKDLGDRWVCRWVMEPTAQHCPSCIENNKKWNPLIVRK